MSLTCSQHILFLSAQSRKLKPFLSEPLKIVSIPPCVDREYRADFYHPAFRKICQNHSDVMQKIEGDLRQQTVPTKFSELSDNVRDMVLDEEWKNRVVTPLGAALEKEENSAIKVDERGLSGRRRPSSERNRSEYQSPRTAVYLGGSVLFAVFTVALLYLLSYFTLHGSPF